MDMAVRVELDSASLPRVQGNDHTDEEEDQDSKEYE